MTPTFSGALCFQVLFALLWRGLYWELEREKAYEEYTHTKFFFLKGAATIEIYVGVPRLVSFLPGKDPPHTPPPRENITKIIRTEYFCVISGGGYGKIA